MRNVLYRALGQTDELEVDVVSFKLTPEMTLILCSNGLLRWIDYKSKEIPFELKNIVDNASGPQQACDQLIALANERGGEDNASVIVIKVCE